MILKNLKKIWKNKFKIFEGIKNFIIRKKRVEEIAKTRMAICKSCKYGFYGGECADSSNKTCCGACGCILKLKVRCLSCTCGAEEEGLEPLWRAVE